jgi:hypothetical protein
MQTSRSRSTNVIALVLSLIASSAEAAAPVGGVDIQTGYGYIDREGQKIESKIKTEIFMNDLVSSKNGDMGITFVDSTVVAISPGSELQIDEFVYDPNNPAASKLSMDVVGGTVRYASGAIAHDNAQSVAINTPTATVAVRGTNFTATVDEIGRSQVILLPNIDGTVGEIEVSNGAGSVILNQAFQATVVHSLERAPTDPKTLENLSAQDINNMIIIKPPKELVDDYMHTVKNALDINWLEFDELKQDLLSAAQLLDNTALAIKPLQVDFLQNVLDAEAAAFVAEMKAVLDGVTKDGSVTGYNELTQVATIINDDGSRQITRSMFHVAQINLEADADYTIDLIQDGYKVPIKIGVTEGAKIYINQSQ